MATPTIYRTFSSPSFDTPRGLAIDTQFDKILVADNGNNRLVLSKVDGLSQTDTLGTYDGNTIGPNGVTYYNGNFYVCDNTNHTLVRLRARDLSYKDHFGTAGSSGSTTSKLNSPIGVTHDKRYLYITDGGNSRIMKLNLETLAYDSQVNNINGSLTLPYGIVYKKEGGEALFISDRDAGKIIKCQTDFTYIEQNTADVAVPQHLEFYADYVHVCDGVSVKILASNGLTSVISYTDSTLVAASGLAMYKGGMFVGDSTNDTVAIWKAYDPFDTLTADQAAQRFGTKWYRQPALIIGEDTLTATD
jgi:DNA-binding beta-propeller fold protein YncE